MGIAGDVKAQQEIARLKSHGARLLRQLDDAKRIKESMVAAVYKAARDAAESVDYEPVKPPTRDRRDEAPETAVVLMSDWQLAKKTPTYSTAICAKRVDEHITKVMRLTDIQRADRPIKKCVVALGGDMVEGELIFPGQEYRIDGSLFRQVMLDGPEILGNALRRLLNYFEEVEVHDVIGNHGALGGPVRKSYHPESNADAMMYHATWAQLKGETRLKWTPTYIPGERAWYKVFQIGRNGYFLFHGDQMRGGGFAGIPMYGFIRAMMAWAAGAIPEPFRFAFCGHWHAMWSIPLMQTHEGLPRLLWVNGSTESGNEWLREELKAQSPPGQFMFFAHERRGITSEHRIWLGQDEQRVAR
jgi:hypothetical protein